ncbi:MAG TPA: serine/threonine-protein kinase, partial [Polyangia bacterium]|nr:serine/threonine-protein kinase [Polyangia bacterium]
MAAGTVVNEFRVEARLGQGGMSTVYSAIQPLIGKRAAIKVIRRELCLDPVQVERFVQEARAVNQIGHPNIVDVFAFGTLPDERSYLVMEWLQGETLAERLKRGALGTTEAMAIIFQICDALAAAHDKGIVHRDLKPENVFLVPVRNRRLLVKLLDFGVAKLRGPRGEARVDHTSPGNTVGTPKYMAPEQARGRDVDYRADVYSLGVTAYEMFTGRVPFLGDEAIDVMHQHVYKMPPAPSLLRADLPLQVERLLLGMLEKKPDKRPTLAQVEARLADVRDQVLSATGESGPIALRALEVGGPRHITAPRQVAVT